MTSLKEAYATCANAVIDDLLIDLVPKAKPSKAKLARWRRSLALHLLDAASDWVEAIIAGRDYRDDPGEAKAIADDAEARLAAAHAKS